MKKNKIILLSFLLFIPIAMFGQNSKDITVNFDEGDFSYEMTNNQLHIISNKRNAFIWGDTIDPALPCVGVNVLVAPTENYISLSYESQESMILQDVVVEPNPIPLPTNANLSLNDNRNVTYTQTEYPKVNVEYTGTQFMDGYKYISLIVCPFRYDSKNKKLYLKKEIKISLNFSTQVKLATLYNNRVGNNMRMIIKNLTVNGNELETLYNENTSKAKSLVASNFTPYKYIIVTNDTLQSIFEKLANWKTIKGVRTKVITVNECYNTYPNESHQLAIKKTLSDYYSNGMEYALLAGDVDIVPVQICRLPNTPYSAETSTDLYYACLDKSFNWDGNENNVYAEANDNIDYAPEFIVTRVSVSNIAEAEIFANRIVEYESCPKTDGWENKILSLGSMTQGMVPRSNPPISDSQSNGEACYNNYIHPYWNGTLFELFDTYTDHPDGANYEVSASHIQTELEKGYIFVDEYSHGGVNKWGYFEDWEVYNNSDADNLINDGYTIISTISCFTNGFDLASSNYPAETDFYTKCLSESFIRNPNSGVLAYFGSSREGWSMLSNLFDNMFYKYLLTGNKKQFGRAAMLAKNEYLGCTSNNTYRWLFLTLNPMGDAEMPIYTDLPKTFDSINVNFSNGTLNVTTGVNSCRICVCSVADNGNSYYNCIENTSIGSFSSIDTDCYLCITKQGYIPYIARVGLTVYLQNETIFKDLPIYSNRTLAGKNVTTSKPQGEVRIEKGIVTNKSYSDFKIKNDFKVKHGAELKILKPQ